MDYIYKIKEEKYISIMLFKTLYPSCCMSSYMGKWDKNKKTSV